jgi:hypothetical protein
LPAPKNALQVHHRERERENQAQKASAQPACAQAFSYLKKGGGSLTHRFFWAEQPENKKDAYGILNRFRKFSAFLRIRKRRDI